MMKCSEAVRMLEAVGCDRSPGDARRLKSHLEQCPECRERSLACDALDSRIAEALDRIPDYRDQTDAVLDELVPYSRPRKPALRWAWALAACAAAAVVVGYGLGPRPAAHRDAAKAVARKQDTEHTPAPSWVPVPAPRPNIHIRHVHHRSKAYRLPEIRRQAFVRRPKRFAGTVNPIAEAPTEIVAERQVSTGGSCLRLTIKLGHMTVTRTIHSVSVPLQPDPALANVERPPLVMTVRPRFASAIERS